MAELAKRPLYKHKGLSKDHQHPRKMPGLALHTYNLSAGEGETGSLESRDQRGQLLKDVCVGKHVLDGVCVHMGAPTHICTYVWRPEVDTVVGGKLLNFSRPYFLQQGVSLNLEIQSFMILRNY